MPSSKKEKERPPKEQTGVERVLYRIDRDLLANEGRSADLMALDCRCPSCWAELTSEPELKLSLTFEEHRARIAECCSQQASYLAPGMPILEAVFRILMAQQRAISLEEVHQTLLERWASPDLPRSVSLEMLRRILKRDTYYGIRELAPGEPEETPTLVAAKKATGRPSPARRRRR